MHLNVVLYAGGVSNRSHLADALRIVSARVFQQASPEALWAMLAENPHPDLVVVTSLRDGCGHPLRPVVVRICRAFPALPVVAYCDSGSTVGDDIVWAARAGLTAAALQPDELIAVLRRVGRTCMPACLSATVLARADTRLTPATRAVVHYCLTHARDSPTVEQIAAALGAHRKTLATRLAREGLPSVSALVSWGRLLQAADLLNDGGRGVENIALALKFESASGFRHMLMRYTGLRPTELLARGALEAVLSSFVAALGPAPGQGHSPCLSARTTCLHPANTPLADSCGDRASL